MRFINTPLEDAFVIDVDRKEDERGFFARFFCSKEFSNLGLDNHFVQVNNSLSRLKGTLRGIHYQITPKEEAKLVRCIKGALYDVIVDLRPNSSTFMQWYGAELTETNRRMMYVPKGFGHAFLTLADDTEALYMVSEYYSPEHERGLRYDDSALKIRWPFEPEIISDKDLKHPPFNAAYHIAKQDEYVLT